MAHQHSTTTPEAWAPRRVAERFLRTFERFFRVEAASGLALLVAALVALIWANSTWAPSYRALWLTPITIGIGRFVFTESVHFWVNDGLMAIFFFVVGLEIRLEIAEGELQDLKRAALPFVAALGGMIAPAAIYIALNRSTAVHRGWGVPMATDIAFAVGVLALLGKRVPPSLRVLLLALAIIDDIGSIVVIAVFYSSGIVWSGLALAACGSGGVVLLQWLGVRRLLPYLVPAALVWVGLLHAGVHPTIAGVILGMLTPARSWFGGAGVVATMREALEELRGEAERDDHRAHDLIAPLRRIRDAQRGALPPVVRLQDALHPWVAYGIMPLFALANAGVSLGGIELGDASSRTVVLGVFLGLVVGKPLGILAASYTSVRIGACALPRDVTWRSMLLMGCVGGIGFTVALFVAGLAFAESPALAASKAAILLASVTSAAIALGVGPILLRKTVAS